MYRKFSLINGNGDTQTLTEPSERVFGHNPTGLGFTTSPSFLRLGNDNIKTYSQYDMNEKEMEILFYDETNEAKYKKYNDFIRFLVVEPIYLIYEINNKASRIKVHIDSLTKGEISHDDSMLHCNLTMSPMSFWEDNVPNVIETTRATSDGKSYELIRPYEYGSVTTDNIEINSVGTIDSPLIITIDGATTNPQYSLADEFGNVYGVGRFIGTFDKVVVNAEEAEEFIELSQGGVAIDNPYNYQDLSIGGNGKYITFLKMKTGQNKLIFSLDAGFNGLVRIEWRNRYVSV